MAPGLLSDRELHGLGCALAGATGTGTGSVQMQLQPHSALLENCEGRPCVRQLPESCGMIQNQAKTSTLTNSTDFGTPITSTGSTIDDSGASAGLGSWQYQWAGQHQPFDPGIRFSDARQFLSTISIEGCAAGDRLDGSDSRSQFSIQVWQWNSETGELDFVGERSASDSQAGEVSAASAKRHAPPAMTDTNRLVRLHGNNFDFESCSDAQCAAVRRQCCSMCEIHRLCTRCNGAIRAGIGFFTISRQDERAIDHINIAERSSIVDSRRVDIRMCQPCLEKTDSGTRTRGNNLNATLQLIDSSCLRLS